MLTKTDLKAIEKLIEPVKKIQAVHSKELKKIESKVSTNTGSLMEIENTIGVYRDALDIERKRIDGHDTRLTKVEETLAI